MKMTTLGSVALSFKSLGLSDTLTIELLKTFLGQPPPKTASKGGVQRNVLCIISNCVKLLDEADSVEYLTLLDLVVRCYESLDGANLIHDSSLDYDGSQILTYLYDFIKQSIKQGFAVESLPLVSILHDSLRSVCTCSDVDRFPDKKPYADIAYRTYYRIYSCFDETLERCYVEDALDVFLFALESIPFCCCSQGLTDLGDTSGWTHALVRMVRKVLTDDRFHFKPRTVSYHIVRILEKCCGVTVKNLLVLTNQLAKVFASFFETPGEIETVMKTVWKDYLVSSDYQEHSMQLLCVITSQHLVEFYRHRYYGVVNGIIKIVLQKRNESIMLRTKEETKAANGPVVLNFDGGIDDGAATRFRHLSDEHVSLKDEQMLLSPMSSALRVLRDGFKGKTWTDASTSMDTVVEIIKEAVALLLNMSSLFQLHRLQYLAVSASQLAWSLVNCCDQMPTIAALSVGTAYLNALTDVRLYSASVDVIEQTSAAVSDDERNSCMLDYGIFAARSAWLFIMTPQVDAIPAAMSTLKSVYENPTLKESEAAYLEGWYLRLSAHLFFLYQNLDVEKRAHLLPFCSQDLSPLWLLETAYTKYCTALSTSTDFDLASRWNIRTQYLMTCYDLAKSFLLIGAPAEAMGYAKVGRKLAVRDFATRWCIVFLLMEAQCQRNHGFVSKFRFELSKADHLLTNKNTSALKGLKLNHKTLSKNPVCDTDSIVSLTKSLTLEEEESDSSGSDNETAFVTSRQIELECFSHPKECYCDQCVDFDLHGSFMESQFLWYRWEEELTSKTPILKRCVDLYGNLHTKPRALYVLSKEEGLVKISRADISSLIEVPFARLRLRHAANELQKFRQAVHMDDILAKLDRCRDLEVLQPDIITYARYLKSLNIIVGETKSQPELLQLIKCVWSASVDGSNSTLIQQNGTVTLDTSASEGDSYDSEKEEEKPLHSTPENEDISRGVITKDQRKLPRKGTRHGRKVNGPVEPEIPSELTKEVAEQAKAVVRRRETMLVDNVSYPGNKKLSDMAASKVQQPKVDLNDDIREAIRMLKDEVVRTESFPLYPYFRMTSSLVALFTGISNRPEEAGNLAGCMGGKLHHMAWLQHNHLPYSSHSPEPQDRLRYTGFTTTSKVMDTSKLPPDWAVCSISLVTQHTLPVSRPLPSVRISHVIVTRWERGVAPLTLLVPVSEKNRTKVSSELNEILAKADRNQKHHDSSYNYWKTRLVLNEDLFELAINMDQLLDYAKALLLTTPAGDADKAALAARLKSVKATVTRHHFQVDTSILRLLILAGLALTPEQLLKLTSILLRRSENSAEVVTLVATISKHPFVSTPCYQRSPLILLLDNDAYELPWESTPTLRTQPVSRLPSIPFVNLFLARYVDDKLNRDRGFYIVNPGADLKGTEERFNKFLQRSSFSSWDGVTGKPPSSDQVQTAFQERDMILYMGHGSGQHVFNLSRFDKRITRANMFLIGCSSVKLDHSAVMDASGFVNLCITMGSPCVMGNLWPVTSACIDQWLHNIMENLVDGKDDGKAKDGTVQKVKKSFLDLLAISRDRIKSNYIVGAAPVFIGLPMTY